MRALPMSGLSGCMSAKPSTGLGRGEADCVRANPLHRVLLLCTHERQANPGEQDEDDDYACAHITPSH